MTPMDENKVDLSGATKLSASSITGQDGDRNQFEMSPKDKRAYWLLVGVLSAMGLSFLVILSLWVYAGSDRAALDDYFKWVNFGVKDTGMVIATLLIGYLFGQRDKN